MKRLFLLCLLVFAAFSCAATVHARSADMPIIKNEVILSTPSPDIEKRVQGALLEGARQGLAGRPEGTPQIAPETHGAQPHHRG